MDLLLLGGFRTAYVDELGNAIDLITGEPISPEELETLTNEETE